MKKPLESFLGSESLGVFFRLPNENYVISSGFCLKIIPSFENGFNFVVGIKYDTFDS